MERVPSLEPMEERLGLIYQHVLYPDGGASKTKKGADWQRGKPVGPTRRGGVESRLLFAKEGEANSQTLGRVLLA